MDKKSSSLILFQEKHVRRHRDEEQEMWYFSVVDVIEILTDSTIPKRYWSDLKRKLLLEWSEVYDKIVQLKMIAWDGKKYSTDCFSTEDLLRIIQSISSPKAEPFKVWLAKVWYERIEETDDPELAFDRAMATYLKKWYTKEWINQRLKSIEIRKELTDERKERGMREGVEYAILTDEITKAWSDKSVKDYKQLKWLKKENLRDNMTNTELILNMLAEASTKDISAATNPKDFEESKKVAKQGGNVAKVARLELEAKTGKKVVTSLNAKEALKALPNHKNSGKRN